MFGNRARSANFLSKGTSCMLILVLSAPWRRNRLNLQASHSQRSIHLPLTRREWLPCLQFPFTLLAFSLEPDFLVIIDATYWGVTGCKRSAELVHEIYWERRAQVMTKHIGVVQTCGHEQRTERIKHPTFLFSLFLR